MDCSICLDKIKCLDLVRLLDCGHQFHNMCVLRNSGGRCPMCRHLTMDTVAYCISNENFNFFELDSSLFNKQIDCLKDSRRIIRDREYMDAVELTIEKNIKHQNVIDAFFKSQINLIKFKILKATKEQLSCIDIHESNYGEAFNEYPLIFLLKGKRGCENYFKDRGVVSLTERIHEYFKILSIFVISDDVFRKNYIRVYL